MKKKLLFTLATLVCAAGLQAQSTNTLSFNAAWNDGGALTGWFTVAYDINGTPIALLAADITTGNSTPGFYSGGQTFAGYTYLYNVNGQSDTIIGDYFDAIQNEGFAANEVAMFSMDSGTGTGYRLFLDWQGSDPTELYLGTVDGEYSSESYDGAPTGDNDGIRFLNTSGGTVEAAPEPGTIALAGLGGAALLVFLRRK